MEVGSAEWIEASLARLDELERQHGEHETALEEVSDPAALVQHNKALEQLDVEIQSLYAQLEAVDDDTGEGEPQAAAPVEAAPTEAVVVAASAEAAPVETPAEKTSEPESADDADASMPERTPPAAPPADPPAPALAAPVAASFGDDDIKVQGGGAKWIFVGLVVAIGVGVGGFFAWKQQQANKPEPTADQGPRKVIKAAEVPDDTESPNAAKGADVTRSHTEHTKGTKADGGGTGGGHGGKTKKKSETKKLDVGSGGDPLG